MEVTITKAENYSEGILVQFRSQHGEAFGIWNGHKRPEENESYNVEFDITEPLEWGKGVKLSKKEGFKIAVTENSITITGKVEKVLGDGFIDFRFGESVIQIEVEGKNIPKGKFVDIITNELEIYAY